jgi:hypothetical protein
MSTYQGPALVGIGESDPDIPVRVNLRGTVSQTGMADWHGTVSVKSQDGQARLVDVTQGRIQFPNGETRAYLAMQPLTPITTAFSVHGSDGEPLPY